ncbi:MAG TPA: GspB domain-containing protein [Desulfuromonadales bacterium]|nr:GspB domain-containing protein [Desulfuromonadales bacterium]
MSSILKALKKVENDNASRRPDELRIDAEILRSENHPRFSLSGMLLVALLLMAFGAGGTYLYMTRDKTSELTDPNASVISGQKRQSVSVTPEIITEQLPPAIVVVPAQQKNNSPGEKVQKHHTTSSQETSPPAVRTRPLVAEQPVLPPQRVTSPPVTHKTITVPALRVNGIAFQEDGSGTVAMINGEPIAKGGIIAGVTVEEIYKNRVKFNYNGELFDVLLGQSNQ